MAEQLNPFSDSPKGDNKFNPFTNQRAGKENVAPISGLRMTQDSKYLEGLTTNSNPNDVKAANQGFWSELGNSLVNFGGEFVLGTVEVAGYLNPLQLITTAFDSEKEYGNVISEWARKKNDELQQELFPVYNNSQTSDISEWFFENLPSIGSAVSLMIPGMAGIKALGVIGKLARGKHLLKAIGVLEGTPAYNAVTGGLETITMAAMSRHAENMMESTETYNKILEEAKAKGFSEDYAKNAAKEAAQSVYNKNWNLIMNDIVQFGMINKGWSTYSRMAKEMATSQTNKITAGSILKQMGIEGAEEGYQFITAEEEARRVAQKYDIRDKDYLTYPERLAKYMVNEDFLTSVFFGALGGGVFEIAGKSVENKLAKQQQLKEELVNGELNKLVSAFQGDKRKFDRERQIDTYRLIFHGLQQGRADQIETAFQQMVDTKPANELSEQETKDINEAGRFGLEKLKKLEEFYNTRRSNNTAETMQFLLGNEATKELTQQDIKYFSDLQTRELSSLATENNLGADMQKLLLLTKEVEELKKLTPKDLNIEENVYNSLIKTKEEQLLPFLDTVKVNYSLTDEQIKEKLKTVDTSVFSTLSNFKVQSEARYNQQVADGKLADTTEGKVKLVEKQSEIKKEVTDKKFQELVKVIQPNTDEEQLIKAKEQAKEIGKEKEFNAAYEKKFRELQLASSKFNKAEVETSLKARWTNNELVKNREQQYIMNMLLQTGGLPEDSILNEEFIAEKYATNPAFATKLDTYYKNANAVIVTTKKEAEKVPVDSSGPDANAQAQSQKKAENSNLSPANPWISAGIQFKYDFSKREFISDENGFVSNDSSLTAAINWKALNQGEVKIGSTINFDFDFNDSFNQGKVKGFEKIDAYNALIFITYYSKENPNTPITLGAVPVWSETKNFGTPEKSKELKAFREKIWSEIQSNKTKSGRITLTPTTSLKAYESGDFYNLRKDGQPLKQNPLNVLRKEHKFVLGIGRQKTTGETYLDFGDASHPYVDKVTAISKIEPGKIYMMVPSLSGSILPVKIFNENLNSFPELMNTVNSLIQEVQNITDPEQKSSLVDRISEIISINNLSYNPETKLYSLIVGPKKEPQTLTFTTEDINQNIGNLRVQIDIGKINKTVNGQPYNKVIADNGYITTDLHPDYFHSSRVVLQPIAINVIQPDQKVDAKVTEKLPDITSSLTLLNLDDVEGIDLDLGDPGKFKVAEDDLVGTLNEQKLRQWFSKNLPQVPLEVVPHLIEIRKNGPKAWGMFKNAAVVLYNAAPHKIGYHEAFHAVFNLFLSKPEQEAILNEASQESGITRSYDTNNQSPRFAAVEYQLKATLGVEIEEKPQGVEAKAGVPELFESNPELANAVYEALGFKTDKKGLIELTHYSRSNKNPLDKFQEDFPLYTSRGEHSEYKDYGKQFNYIVKKAANIKTLLDFDGKYGIDLDKHDMASKGLQPYHFSLQEIQAIRKEGVDILIDDWGEYIILNPNSVVLKEQQKQQAQQLYSQYLDTIFPDSKVKDIVYHGSHLSGIEKFDFTKQRTNLTNYLPKGGYFTSEKLVANSYSDVKGKIYSVLLNIKNPRIIQGNEDYNDLSRTLQKEAGVYKKQGITNKEITDALESLNKEIINNNDGIIFLKIKDSAASSEFKPIYNYGELSYNEDNENTYVVFEPEQIHILGNKQDIKGFKEFVQNKQSITPRKGISELFAENPQLASIGTQEQYERYLSTIFPNSKVKDIVYHGGYNKIEKFDKKYLAKNKTGKTGELGSGFYFSTDKEYVEDQYDGGFLGYFILNLKTPFIEQQIGKKNVPGLLEGMINIEPVYNTENFTDEDFIKSGDGVIAPNRNNQIVVFEPEQIHILGNKQDIEGFKSFIKSNLKQVEYQQVNLTKKQRNEIIRLSTTDQSVYTTNDLKLEEYLADKLMNYIMEDQVNEGSLMYNIRQFFRKLWSTIKSIFNSKVDIDTLFYRINTGYYKGAALPASANQERYKVVEDPIIAKRRVGMINYQFFSVLDNLRNNNPLYTNLTDSEIIRKIGNTDSKIIRKIGNDHIKEGLIAVYSRVLKGLQKAEFGLPETDSRKAKLKSIIDQFFIINSDNEISDKDGYFGKALKDLTRYGFTVTPEGETNLQVLEDIENKTFDELYEEETSDQIYNKTKLNENPKDNLSYEVRKVLRRLERYIYKNGEFITGVSETNDDLGFKSFADYDEVVNYLNANLANINDSDEMVDKLKELQYDRPELHGLLIKVLENPQFKTQFFVSLNKAYVAYLKVLRRERKIYSADPFGEEETDIQMQVINMNRKGLSQLIIDDWNVNLLNSQGNNITTDNKIDTTKAKQYLEQYEQILKEIVSLKQEKLPLEYANKLSENLKNFGIIIDPQVFVRQYEKDNASVKVNDVKKNKEPKTPQESFNVLTKGKDSILSILKAISVGNNPYEGDTIESSTIRKVAYSVAANSLHLHQDSIINVEGEQQYSYVLPSFLTNLVNRLKSQEYRESLLNNWWFKHNSFLKELNLEENYDLRDQFGVAIFGGNQLSQGYGKSYRKLTVKDLAIADITLYFNNGNSEYANYRVPILSDSPTSVVYKFKKYDQEKIIDGLYAIALAEKERIDLTSNTNYDINVWSQRGKEYHFLDIFNNSDIDINNEPQAKEAIKNWLDSEFENEKRRLEDLGIYRKDNFFSSYLDTRLSTASKEDLIKNYFYNKVHANANIIQLTSVDLAFYKGAINFQKRNGQISKLTQRLDTKAVWKDGTAVGEQYKSIYLTDLKTNTELFEGVNVTDAQSYITLDRYKKIMIGLGQWTDKHENVFQKAKKGAWSADFVDFIPSSLKPFMFGHETFANTDITIPVQHKNSQVLLIPAFAKGNSTLQKILDFKGDTIDELEFADSAVKVGAYGAVSIEEFLKGKEPVIHILNNKDWGLQQTVPAKHLDVEVLLGTQIKKLALSDLPNDIEIMGMNKQQLFETYQKLLTDNIIDSYNNLVGEFTNIEKVQELLLKQVRDRGLSESYEDALKIVVDQKGNKVFNIPLFDPIHGRRMQNILNAIVRNNVTKQKIKGGSLSLVSSFGLSKKLNIVRDKNGAVEYMEVMLPAYTRKLFSKKGKNGEVNIKEIQEESPEILDLVGYRIPTEGWHSIKKLRIVGFTPEIMGGVALLPYDITTIAGEDFDIDKMYVILPNVEEVDGKLRKVKYNLSKELNKTQRDNAILDIISEIYSHPSMGKTVLTPGGFDTLKILMRDIESRYGVLIPSDNILLPSVEARYFDINSNGGNLIGIAANHNSSYALFQYSDLALQTPITIDGNSLSSLHTTDSLDPNRTVGKNLSEFLAAFVDTAKDPVATGLNLNTFTFDTVALLVRLGFDLKTAMYFINQPILKKLVKDYTNQGSGEKTLEKIVDEIRTAYKEVLGELPKPGRYALKTSKLEEYLTNIEFIPDQTAKKEAMRYQMLVLETFLNIRKDATALSALIGATKADTHGTGKTLAENVYYLQAANNAVSLDSLVGVDSVLNIPLIKTSLEYGIEKPQKELLGKYFPYDGELFRKLINVAQINKGERLTEEETNYLFNNYIHYFVSNFDAFDETKRSYYLNKYPEQFVALKNKYNNLELVKYLAVKEPDKFNRVRRIEFTSTATISAEQIEKLQAAWMSMLGSDNAEIKKLAYDLLNYTFFSNYFGFKYSGFSHLVPTQILENLVNKEGVTYRDFVYKLQDEKRSTHTIKNYLNQLYRHQHDFNSLVTRVNRSSVSLVKKTKDNFVTSLLLNEDKARELQLHDEDGVIKKEYLSYKNTDGVVYTFAYAGHTSKNEVVYNIQSNLGYDDKIVEFSRLNTIKSVLLINHLPKFEKSDFFDTTQDYSPLYSIDETNKEVEKADENLNNILKGFASSLGITIADHENLKTRLGTNAKGLADIYNKLILISQGNQDINTLPEEVGHFAEAYSRNTMFHSRLMELVSNTDEYKEVLQQYGELYNNDETLLRRETIGKLIGKAIVKRYKETRNKTNNIILQFLEALWNNFIKIFRRVNASDFNKEIGTITDMIAEKILAGEVDIFTDINVKIGEKFYRLGNTVDVNEALNVLEKSIKSIYKKIELYNTKLSPDYLQQEKNIQEKLLKNYNNENYKLGLLQYVANARIELGVVAQRYNQISNLLIDGEIPQELDKKRELIKSLRGAKNYIDGFSNSLKEIASLELFTKEVNDKIKATYATTLALNNDYITLSRKLLVDLFKEYATNPIIKQDLENAISYLDNDITYGRALFDSLAESTDGILEIMDKITKDFINKYRIEMLNKAKEVVDLQRQLERDGFKSTNWMYERDFEGNLTGYYVSKWNIGQYEKARKAFFDSIGKRPTNKEKQREWSRKVSEWFNENNQTNPNYKELLSSKKEEFISKFGERIGLREYNAWVAKNTKEFINPETGNYEIKYIKELAIPSDKYLSRQYKEIQENSNLKKYYDKYLEILNEADKQMPGAYKLHGKMPQVRKDFFERLAFVDKDGSRRLKSPKEYLEEGKDTLLDAFRKQDGADTEFGLAKLTNEKGEVVNFVPAFYTKRIDSNMLSTDASSALIAYLNSAYNFKAMDKLVDIAEMTKDVLAEREVATGNFDPLATKFNKLIGKPGKQKITIKGAESKAFNRYVAYMEMVVYGMQKKDGSFAKIADTLNTYTSLSALAVNAYAGVANLLYGNTMLTMEAFAGELINKKDMLEASKIYTTELPDAIKDIGARNVSSKINLWSEYMNTLQDYNRELKDANTGRSSIFSRLFTQSSLYFTNKAGEHMMQLQGSLALANRVKVKDSTGQIMNLWEAFEVINVGTEENPSYRLKLKDGLTKVSGTGTDLFTKAEDGKPLTEKDINRFINRQNFFNKRLHGIYNDVDKASIQRYAIGRMALLFRRWIKPGWNRRFEKLTYNEEGEVYTEGYYYTTYRFFKNLITGLAQAKDKLAEADQDQEKLTATEKANLIRAGSEFAFLLATATLASLATSLADDDEDNWVYAFVAYELLRVHSELQFYSNPQEFGRILKSPLPAMHQLEKLNRLVRVWNWNDEIKRGKYEGLKQYEVVGIELVPLTGTYFNFKTPEEQLKYFTNNPPVFVSLTNEITK